jgi:hypothetical protein
LADGRHDAHLIHKHQRLVNNPVTPRVQQGALQLVERQSSVSCERNVIA